MYVIERRVAGTHFHISTRAHTLGAAMKHLERFEADPDNYKPSHQTVGLALTSALVIEYRGFQVETKGVTRGWANDCQRLLADWADDLVGKDLLKLDLQKDVKPALARRKTTLHHRAIALKGFFKWLRKEKGLLKHHQDVTLDLSIPKIRASKLTRPKNVEIDRVRAVAPHLTQHVLDVLILQMGTGWHISEVRRFAPDGDLVEVARGDGVLAVLVAEQKNGRLTRTPLRNPEHLEAARRIKARGRIVSNNTLAYHLKRAATKAGLPAFTLGSMRHSVSTWAIERGARMVEVAEFFDHRSKNTTNDHYANAAVPTVSIPVHTIH